MGSPDVTASVGCEPPHSTCADTSVILQVYGRHSVCDGVATPPHSCTRHHVDDCVSTRPGWLAAAAWPCGAHAIALGHHLHSGAFSFRASTKTQHVPCTPTVPAGWRGSRRCTQGLPRTQTCGQASNHEIPRLTCGWLLPTRTQLLHTSLQHTSNALSVAHGVRPNEGASSVIPASNVCQVCTNMR